MVSMRFFRSSSDMVEWASTKIPSPPGKGGEGQTSLRSLRFLGHHPAIRVVVGEIVLLGDPAGDHRHRHPPLLGKYGEVDVGDDHRDQPDGGKTVEHVHPTPGRILQ